MNALSLYSGGCDGLSLAASWAGIETVAMCECDPHCRAQLARREPDKPIFTYDTEVTPDALRAVGISPGAIDIILASPPCQCASVAGKRLGAADGRNRWPQCLGILRALRPRWFVAENVPGLLTVNHGGLFACILGELAEMGYDAGWCVYGADDVGAPHRRDRLCVVAYHPGVGRGARRPAPARQCRKSGVAGGRTMPDADRDGRCDGADEKHTTKDRVEAFGEFAECRTYRKLADAHGTNCERPVENANQTGRGGSSNGGSVGDAQREGCLPDRFQKSTVPSESGSAAMGNTGRGAVRDDLSNDRSSAGEVDKSAGSGALGHTDGTGREEQNTTAVAGEPRHVAGECAVGSMGNAQRGGQHRHERRQSGTQPALGCSGAAGPGLGRYAHGVLARLAAQRWPAGRGAPQHPWEPPRTVTGMKYRAPLIKMLGNAVVPQWAFVTLAVIAELERLQNG